MNKIEFTDEQILALKKSELERVTNYFDTPESSKWNYITQLKKEIEELEEKLR